MKRTFIKLCRATLSPITSHRQHIGTSRHNIAYRGDANDDDDDEELLDKKLGAVKAALEKHLTRKQREELERLEETLEEKLNKRFLKNNAPLVEQVEASKKIVEEMKVSNETIQKSLEAATTKTAELEKTVSDQKEIITKNQPIIDAFVVNKDKKQTTERKSFGQIIADTVMEKQDDVLKFARKEIKSLSLDLKIVGDMTTSNVDGSRYGVQFAPSIIQGPYRRVHVRDLVPTGTAGPGNSFVHMREQGTGEGAIAPTAETSTKPQIDLDLKEVSVNFEVIAGWLRVTRKAMNNVPGFISWIQSRLPEKLLQIEDAQLLYGDGSTPNISGIADSGNHTAADDTADILAERLIDAISQMEDDLERYPDGILVRPKEYYGFFKNKATDSGVYDLPKNFSFVNGVLYISGVPVRPSTAVEDGDYFVGDWSMGAQLLIQEGIKLEFFEQDADNVTKNKVTVRIEETVAFPIYGDTFFILGEVPSES